MVDTYVHTYSETQILCYKYNKPIRSTIFEFNNLVSDLYTAHSCRVTLHRLQTVKVKKILSTSRT